jgi:ribose transport system permease protein
VTSAESAATGRQEAPGEQAAPAAPSAPVLRAEDGEPEEDAEPADETTEWGPDGAPGDQAASADHDQSAVPVAATPPPVVTEDDRAEDDRSDDDAAALAHADEPEIEAAAPGDTRPVVETGVVAPRDPVRIHLIWEAVLALLLAGGLGIAFVLIPEVRSLDFFRDLLRTAGVLGAVAIAFSLSLRGAVPNLAVVPLAALGAATYANVTVAGAGTTEAVLRAVGLAAALGLLMGALVVGLRVASWAASAAVALLSTGLAVAVLPDEFVSGPDLSSAGPLIFAGVAALSIGTGLLCLIPAVRRTLGAYRDEVGSPRPGASANVVAVVVLVVSSAVAGVAGVLPLLGGEPPAAALTAEVWLPLAAVFLGGASVHGRRVGVTGTVLAVLVLSSVNHIWLTSGIQTGPIGAGAVLAIAGIAATIGLLATPLVEWAGRRAEVTPSA